MKKYIALMLTLALILCLSACSCAKAPVETTPTTMATEATKPAETEPTTVPTEQTQPAAGKTLSGTMEENINKIVEENPTEFMGGVIPIDLQDASEDGLLALTAYTGLTSGEKLKDGAVYEPMMGSQAFSLVLVRVADAADAESVAREMKQNINPRKWICVEANQIMAAGYGDVVMFIMLDSQLGKTAQSYVDAFERVCGGKLDFTI